MKVADVVDVVAGRLPEGSAVGAAQIVNLRAVNLDPEMRDAGGEAVEVLLDFVKKPLGMRLIGKLLGLENDVVGGRLGAGPGQNRFGAFSGADDDLAEAVPLVVTIDLQDGDPLGWLKD